MFKKIVTLMLAAVLSISIYTSAFALNVKINDESMELETKLVDDKNLVPVRSILEALGAEITWNAETQTVIGKIASTKVTLKLGTDYITVNGTSTPLGITIASIDGTTYVPLRAVAEALGNKVTYDAETQTVIIEKGELPWTISDVFNGIIDMKGWDGDIAFSIGDTVMVDDIECATIIAYGDNGAIGTFAISYDFADVFEITDEGNERLYLCR